MPRRPIEFGLAIDFARPAEAVAQRTAQIDGLLALAEASGFTSVWAGEQYSADAGRIHLPAPFLVLASLIGRTRLKLGTGVLVIPAYHPLRLAYEAALLDVLSDGRLIVGAGVGSPALAERFGVPPARVGVFVDDTLSALRALWRGAEGFTGASFRLTGTVQPQPVQPGGPPLWVGGMIGRSAERAARHGDAWYGGMHSSYALVVRQIGHYRRALAALGTSPDDGRVALNRLLVLADSDADAVSAGGAAIDPHGLDGPVPMQLVGSPETVAAAIRAYAEAGVTNMQLRVFPAGVTFEQAQRTLTLFRDAVLPALR
ncbi:MAG: LLM class flavin-dependent oxidoreductase [Chloroflexi bacterium]|nr:LLM class flavin-dependent oxidoreductase [Chloroflexota bacterium]